jgi:hypothetical protein
MSAAPHVARKTIRRHQLREIVPLADSTMYDMEQRGELQVMLQASGFEGLALDTLTLGEDGLGPPETVGHQEVVSLKQDQEVALVLYGSGPPHRPRLAFELRPLSETRTQVLAHFINELPRPFNAIWKFAGLSKWTREMHRKDLAGLKAFSEPPHRDINGQVVGRPPRGVKPSLPTHQTRQSRKRY